MGATQQHDDGHVRVTRWTLHTGESTGPHVHEYDYVVVPLSNGRMTVHLPGDEIMHNQLTPGETYLRPRGTEHDVHNDGAEVVDFVEVELLDRPLDR